MIDLVKVKCKRVGNIAVEMPRYAREGDAGLDLRAVIRDGVEDSIAYSDDGSGGWSRSGDSVVLYPGARCVIPVGWAFEIPTGYEGQVRGRSSLTLRGIYCAVGTIDAGYRGEVAVCVENRSGEDFEITTGDRIAQLVIAPVACAELEEAEALGASERGNGGFGSTGVREIA